MGLRLVAEDGTLVEASEHALTARLIQAEEDLQGAEKALRKERRRSKALETEKQHERERYEQRQLVTELFEFWQRRTKHAKSRLTPDRFDVLRSALDQGYTPREIALAIAGCAFDPFVTQNRNGRSERHDDLTVCLRSGKALEQYARKAPRVHS